MAMSETGARRVERSLGLSLWRDARFKREAAEIAPYLDADYYLENNADVAAAGLDASLHYAKYGWREGRDPSASFSTKGYLSAHPKVALEGTNPLLHFIRSSGAALSSAALGWDAPCPDEVALVAEHLDLSFYTATRPDCTANGLTPAEHYCRIGWREGADPAPDFSTSYYLTTNPDVRERGVNPFWHYLIAGRTEGRLPIHPGGWRHAVLSRQTTFADYCKGWLRQDSPAALPDADEVAALIADARQGERLLLSVGHDDYRATPGGVQLCIEIEEKQAIAQRADYLNLHPWQPLPKLAEPDDDPLLTMVMNGRTLGTAHAWSIVEALGQAELGTVSPEFVIHHLAGHAPETIVAMAEGLGLRHARLWLHDYFTLCTSYALQRNSVSSCNAPDAGSNACRVCLFGSERSRQAPRMSALFERLEIEVISPSRVALEFWQARAGLNASACVIHPHIQLAVSRIRGPKVVPPDAPVRIAFVGTPAPHKGWPVFRELQRRLRSEPGYEFWFFGSAAPGLDDVRHVETHVRAADPDATMRAIASQEIDLVLHWASWRETFSFSTFEALAGGAFVLTNAGSGNVAAAVTELDRGIVLETTGALYDLAKSGGLRSLAVRARKMRRTEKLLGTFSAMTLDLLEGERPG